MRADALRVEMPPRFVPEIEEFLRVNGPTTESGLASHFAKWGASDEDLRGALDWLVRESRVERVLDRGERFRLRT